MPQIIRVQGVVDNGSKYTANVPKNTSREVRVARLADVRFDICVVFPNGSPVLVADKFTLGIRDPSFCSGPFLEKAGTFSAGLASVDISGLELSRFCSGRLAWDAWLAIGADRYQVVALSVLRLLPNVATNP